MDTDTVKIIYYNAEGYKLRLPLLQTRPDCLVDTKPSRMKSYFFAVAQLGALFPFN